MLNRTDIINSGSMSGLALTTFLRKCLVYLSQKTETIKEAQSYLIQPKTAGEHTFIPDCTVKFVLKMQLRRSCLDRLQLDRDIIVGL